MVDAYLRNYSATSMGEEIIDIAIHYHLLLQHPNYYILEPSLQACIVHYHSLFLHLYSNQSLNHESLLLRNLQASLAADIAHFHLYPH
jgi:hypothetical protein